MGLSILKRDQQVAGQFNLGAILENKPLGFPHEKGLLKQYSNIFYWANATCDFGSTLAEHPHQGFEILSYVIKGSLEHYDNKNKEWINIATGDAQLIKAGSGISHAERFSKDCQMFQIWFDPNVRESLKKPASYIHVKSENFPAKDDTRRRIKTIVGEKSFLEMDTPGIQIWDITFMPAFHNLNLSNNSFYSAYVLKNEIEINNRLVNTNDFFVLSDVEQVEIHAAKEARIFLVESPAVLSYLTYYQMSHKI